MKRGRALIHDLAGAAFRAAEADGSTEATGKALTHAAGVLRAHPRLRQSLLDPRLTADGRAGLLDLLGPLPDTARGLLGALTTRRRLGDAAAVARAYAALAAARATTVPVEVETAAPLSRADAARLQDVLARSLGRAVALSIVTRRSLLGGLRIRAGELVIDGSVQGGFDRLARELGLAATN